MWGDSLANKRILFFTDNNSVVHVINRQTSKNKELLYLLRQLVLKCLRHNILLRARHIRERKISLLAACLVYRWGDSKHSRRECNRCAATPPFTELGEILSSLSQGFISTSSLYTYQSPCLIFKQFLYEELVNSSLSLPVSVHDLALIIAYLAKSKYLASTVNTYICSIGLNPPQSNFPKRLF